MDRRKHSAGISVEHIVGLVVADLVDYPADSPLDIHVGILRTYLTAYNNKPGAAECFAGYF